ncbi:recombination mediator RecR [Hirschia litorea]|uniref:Recombination protein RecR n=1 Tax=Hirschia litorea TaxID=1199156 RepID=A0ABW2IK06_9PROT
MSTRSVGPEITRLIEMMSKLPGMGPRSARRAALHLLKKPDQLLAPLSRAMADAAQKVSQCQVCGNFDTLNPCAVCQSGGRDESVICVLADVGDLWAMERSGVFRGRYHVLGGSLSALDGIGPEDLNIARLISRAGEVHVKEVILALNATVDGQTTAHYVADQLETIGVKVSRLAHGVPVGGELGSLDDGTIAAAFSSRR